MHPRMDFARIHRIFARSAELAAEPRMHLCVVETYKDCLATLADAFAKAHAAVSTAESAWRKDSHAMREALARLDAPFRAARSTLRVYEPGCALPPTLKSQRTDTDKLVVIEELCNAVKAHAGKTWADGLLQGEFAALAQQGSTALWASIASSKALESARNERMTAYLAAHRPFVAFKRLVRDALGASSPQYRRIHVRKSSEATMPEEVALVSKELPEPRRRLVLRAAFLDAGPSESKVADADRGTHGEPTPALVFPTPSDSSGSGPAVGVARRRFSLRRLSWSPRGLLSPSRLATFQGLSGASWSSSSPAGVCVLVSCASWLCAVRSFLRAGCSGLLLSK